MNVSADLASRTVINTERKTFVLNGVGGDDVQYDSVVVTDFYRNGRPYIILGNPGVSCVRLRFEVPNVAQVVSVMVTLNHCRTTADGCVDFFVNENEFVTNYKLSPRNDFDYETFTLPKSSVKERDNWFNIRLNRKSPGVYWLSDVHVAVCNAHLVS